MFYVETSLVLSMIEVYPQQLGIVSSAILVDDDFESVIVGYMFTILLVRTSSLYSYPIFCFILRWIFLCTLLP